MAIKPCRRYSVAFGKRYNGARGVTYYEVLVSDSVTQWSVGRRYKDFECLHTALRGDMELPPMPGRSAIKIHISEAFIEERQDALADFLQRVLETDPQAKKPEVRQFLDVRTPVPIGEEAHIELQAADPVFGSHMGSVELIDLSGLTNRKDFAPADVSSDESTRASGGRAESWDLTDTEAPGGKEPDNCYQESAD